MEPDLPVPAHARPGPGILADLATDAASGLTTDEAARRLDRHGANVLRETPPEPQWHRLLRQFADPLVYLLLAAVVISVSAWLLEGEENLPIDAIVIAAIVIANAAIGFLQERRADNAVAELRRMVASMTTVVRDGVARRVDVADLVPGDVVLVNEGDVVPADGRLLEAHGLRTAEAPLTGESAPVDKTVAALEASTPIAERSNSVFAATSIVAGTGRMVVVGTGMGTEVGAIADMLEATTEQPTPLEREVARVGRTLGIAVVLLAVVLVGATFLVSEVQTAGDTVELMLVGVSLAVAAVPEGLPAVLSLVLALGVGRMARRNALVKRLAFAETLGSTSVICTDKTGTLTQNTMTVRSLATGSGIVDMAADLPTPLRPDDIWNDPTTAALALAALASDAEPGHGPDRAGDPTELALVDAATRGGVDVTALRLAFPRTAVEPFDSIRKRMTTTHSSAAGEFTVTKGAPDVVVPLCRTVGLPGATIPLDESGRAAWSATIDDFAGQALRTMAVATTTPADAAGGELTLLGVFGIIDPPRPEARDAVATARAAGVRVVMITGDHPLTASRIAAEIGIGDGTTPAVRGVDLDGPDVDLAKTAATTDVFARVAPRHKLQLVESLQEQGHVVAMTGDGVNDAPALKAADIGVAMGITGSDVSKGAADMILTDDNFATIVAAVEEGRSIFANVQAFMRYLLSSNMGEVLTMFLGVALAGAIGLDGDSAGVVAPLAATQILWINLLTDTGPALALGVDPVDHALMGRPPRRSTDSLIDRTMLMTVATLGTTMAIAAIVMIDYMLPGGLIEGDESLDVARTGAFTVLVLAQLFNAFATRSENRSAFSGLVSNRWLIGAVALSLLLQILVVHHEALNDAFSTAPLSVEQWLVATALASSVLWVSEVRSFVGRRREAP